MFLKYKKGAVDAELAVEFEEKSKLEEFKECLESERLDDIRIRAVLDSLSKGELLEALYYTEKTDGKLHDVTRPSELKNVYIDGIRYRVLMGDHLKHANITELILKLLYRKQKFVTVMGYKRLNMDMSSAVDRSFVYEVGESYELDVMPIERERGFHFSMNPEYVSPLYNRYESRLFVVEAVVPKWMVDKGDTSLVTGYISIVEECKLYDEFPTNWISRFFGIDNVTDDECVPTFAEYINSKSDEKKDEFVTSPDRLAYIGDFYYDKYCKLVSRPLIDAIKRQIIGTGRRNVYIFEDILRYLEFVNHMKGRSNMTLEQANSVAMAILEIIDRWRMYE